ncbi:MAG: type II toxin-antitoxin system HicA family toxin [Clostridiaceae bacterium]|nr:type II toxin-antitoxin system HicA family toxin [Clostridiaceae bacterium]
MSKKEKLLERLLSKPSDFEYSEVKSLLAIFGYSEDNRGHTSGSRVAFINRTTKHIIRLHRPHPGNILKRYQIELIIDELKKQGVIEK